LGLVVNNYGVLEVDTLKTRQLCVGSVCVTEEEFRAVFGAPALEPVIEPILEPIIEPVLEPVIEPILEPIIEPVLEPVIEPVLEPRGIIK